MAKEYMIKEVFKGNRDTLYVAQKDDRFYVMKWNKSRIVNAMATKNASFPTLSAARQTACNISGVAYAK